MRNLKKVLALVLALVMSMSLVTIASASDFTDADKITKTEAVDVMSAIGVLNGLETGAFNPTGTLTREQAAKIICTMLLGQDNAEKLGVTSTTFKDVAATRWSAPYIAYCASMGIVAGNGDGTFNPTGKLTGYAFGKMLLVALGYEGEYTGANWTINVAKDVVDADLDDGLDIVFSAAISREDAAQMSFNALFYTNEDENTKTVYTIKVTTDADESMKAVKDTSYDTFTEAYLIAQSAADAADKWSVEKSETVDATGSLASEVFKLSKSTTTDDFMRPATSYVSTVKNHKVDLVIADEADYTFEGKVTGKDMYNAVGSEAATKYTWTNYVDGVQQSTNKPSKTSNSAFEGTTNGMLTEVYVDSDDKTVTVSTINTYIGEVKKVTEADAGDDRYVTLTNGKTFETEDFAKKDVVLYTYSKKQVNSADAGIQSMTLANVITGNLDKVVTKSGATTYTVDGVEYSVSAQGTTSLTAASLNKEVSFYVDAQGNIMKDKSAAETENSYIYVLGNAASKDNDDYITGSGSAKTVEVYGVLADGKVDTLTVDVSGTVNANDYKGKLFTYETDSDTGHLELTEVTGAVSASDIAVKGTSVTYNTNKTALLNSDTVFVFIETKSSTNMTVENTTVKVGNANIGSKIVAGKAFVGADDGVAEIVFVTSAYVDSSTDSGDYAYVDSSTQETVVTKVDGSNKTQYSYTAYTTEGDEITLISDTTISSNGVYKYNDDMTVGAQKTSASGIVTAINGSAVTVGSTTLNRTDDTAEVFLNDDVELLVGQTITYVVGSDDAANDIQALWVTADQNTYALTLNTTAVDSDYKVTTDTADVVGGSGVVNTVKITVEKKVGNFNANKAITLTATGTGVAVVGTVTPSEATNTVTFEVTVTAPSAATEITVSAVNQAS